MRVPSVCPKPFSLTAAESNFVEIRFKDDYDEL